MSELWKLRDSFAYFGTVAANLRWSWSARSPDGKTVALTWWRDESARDDRGRWVYDMRDHPRVNIWRGRHGNRDRIRNLTWTREHCDGLFRIVWCEASDVNARVRKAIARYPDKDLWMRLVHLDDQTGEFLAIQA
jgi:hypothetical protein